MIYFAIRHIATGKFMPAKLTRGSGRGYTYWFPERNPPTEPPRLFKTARAASCAAACWARGTYVHSYEDEVEEFGIISTVQRGTRYDSEGRNRGDLEIVVLDLIEVDVVK